MKDLKKHNPLFLAGALALAIVLASFFYKRYYLNHTYLINTRNDSNQLLIDSTAQDQQQYSLTQTMNQSRQFSIEPLPQEPPEIKLLRKGSHRKYALARTSSNIPDSRMISSDQTDNSLATSLYNDSNQLLIDSTAQDQQQYSLTQTMNQSRQFSIEPLPQEPPEIKLLRKGSHRKYALARTSSIIPDSRMISFDQTDNSLATSLYYDDHHINYSHYLAQPRIETKEDSIIKTLLPEIHFAVEADTFFTGSSNLALLNSGQDFDKAMLMQTIVNLPLHIYIPGHDWGKLEFNFTGRINTLWGSSELAKTTRDFVKIGRGVTETNHYHELDRPVFWAGETWLKIISESEESFFQIGLFPKQIGLGLVLGNHYKVGNPLLISTQEKFVDQYRPGLAWHTTFGKRNCTFDFYYSMYKNNATSFDKRVEFTQCQELCCNKDACSNLQAPYNKTGKPSRTQFQTSHIISAEFDIPVKFSDTYEKNCLHIKPFFMYNKDCNQTVEFFGDAESNLVTFGSSFHIKNDRFEGDFDIAGNLGFQEVKAWDRNVTEEHARMTLTHLFAKDFSNVDPNSMENSGEFLLSPVFPYPPGEDISLQHEAGEEFQANNPNLIITDGDRNTVNLNYIFKNSFSRFRNCYKNKYSSFMAAADLGYKFCETKKVGMIFGYAQGDENPNDYEEKAILHRMRSDWNDVRLDKDSTYNGFIGIQPLYTGNHVRTMQLLRAQKLFRPLSQEHELTPNHFSNIVYGGLGIWTEKEFSRGTLKVNSNVIGMGLAHALKFGFDPTVQNRYETFDYQDSDITTERFAAFDKTLSQGLGVEFNTFLEFFAKKHLMFYGIMSIFVPGGYYNDIKHCSANCGGKQIPFKNQYVAIGKDKGGFESALKDCITLLNDTSVSAYVGIKFDFDTSSFWTSSRKRKKKNIR